MTDELLTPEAVAERCHVAPQTVKAWLRAGRLRGARLGGARAGWVVRASDLERYIDAHSNRPAPVER
jgi:predicted site-specific integrase-resolvase